MLDAVVIGTGFGGAVSACRLAQAKLSVCVLERGRRYPKGSFPRDWRDPTKGWLWASHRGLYDVKPINEMTIVQAAGYGGGSLVYANVHLRPVPDVFAQGWPAGYDRAMLDPYYDLVAYMLDIQPITSSPRGLPPKTVLMEKVARSLDRRDQFCYPNLAVNFGPDGQVADNKHGVSQGACNHCGECDIGCNIHAKNTLDLNYLALAERAGAAVRTECEATGIEPLSPIDPGAGYRVVFTDHALGGTQSVEARTVFLCAGAVNSSELLLRCRDEHKTLPRVSDRLGERYSGNGDSLSFMFDGQEFRPSEGPTITTGIVVDEGKGDGKPGAWFILEDGGAPRELAALLQVLRPDANPFGRADALLRAEVDLWAKRAADKTAGQSDDRSLRSGVFLSMGRDRANGRITLDKLGCLRVLWDVPSNLPLYDLEQQVATDVAVALGGKVAFSPLWEQARTPVSVHNLGGCVMADAADRGVTDGNGVVFGYPGLYVMDGGALPEATGVNPSHTIAAVAERNVEQAIRTLTGQFGWQAPERAKARPIVDPIGLVKIPVGGTVPPRTPTIGITFSEKLSGHYQSLPTPIPGQISLATFEDAEAAGKKDGHQLIADITVTIAGLDRFLQDPSHTAALTGTIRADGLTPPGGSPIRAGVFNMYPHDAGGGAQRLRYTMPFLGLDERDYVLDGTANVLGQTGHFDPGATRVVYVSLRKGLGGEGPIMARGIIRLGLLAMLNEMRSMRVTGNANLLVKKDALAAFLKAFAGPVAESFVKEIVPGA